VPRSAITAYRFTVRLVRNGFDDQRMARGCYEGVHLLTDLLTAALDQGGQARTPAGSRATERA